MRFSISAVLKYAGGFDRRANARWHRYPDKMLLLARSPPDTVCQIRQGVAREMLECAETDMNVQKLKSAFPADLMLCASHGTYGVKLWTLLRGIRRLLLGDTRDREIKKQHGQVARGEGAGHLFSVA